MLTGFKVVVERCAKICILVAQCFGVLGYTDTMTFLVPIFHHLSTSSWYFVVAILTNLSSAGDYNPPVKHDSQPLRELPHLRRTTIELTQEIVFASR